MPQSLARIPVQTVFSSKDRRPFLRDTALRQELHHYLGGIPKNLDCQPVIVDGVEDHVRLRASLSRTSTAAEMVNELKRGTPLWVRERDARMRDVGWQRGYGIFFLRRRGAHEEELWLLLEVPLAVELKPTAAEPGPARKKGRV